MDDFYKKLYLRYGETKFLIGFCILFSIIVNFLASFTIVVFLGSELSVQKIVVYTIAYLFVGIIVGNIRIKKIKEDKKLINLNTI